MAAVGLPILAMVLAGLAPGAKRGSQVGQPGEEDPLTPLFTKTAPAENPTALTLAVDDGKVLGWVSGKENYAGQEVVVRAGEVSQTVTVQRDNTFTWHYSVDKPTAVAFTVGSLTSHTRVTPPEKLSPSVFFVVDRTVYRPGQKLQFAGFLREPGRGGRFQPLGGKEVKVALQSKAKKTTAGEMTMTSDLVRAANPRCTTIAGSRMRTRANACGR